MLNSDNMSVSSVASKLPLSVVVAAEGDGAGVVDLLGRYRETLDARGQSYEFIMVFDHRSDQLHEIAYGLIPSWPEFVSLPQRPWAGEDNALKLGVDRTAGDVVLTLPSWSEVAPEAINLLVESIGDVDMATGKRTGLKRSGMQKLRAVAIHQLLHVLFQQHFDDVFCRARAGRREVFLRSSELGVRQHFLPVIAVSEGYEVREIELPVDDRDGPSVVYKFKPNAHVGAFADLLTLFVALKFLKRPLRFFGAIGVPLIAVGALLTLWLVIERLIFGESLSDRPAFVFSVMTFVLGIQVLALGLVGEIIIFSTSRRMRSYEIDRIIRGRPQAFEASDDLPDAAQDDAHPPEQDKQ